MQIKIWSYDMGMRTKSNLWAWAERLNERNERERERENCNEIELEGWKHRNKRAIIFKWNESFKKLQKFLTNSGSSQWLWRGSKCNMKRFWKVKSVWLICRPALILRPTETFIQIYFLKRGQLSWLLVLLELRSNITSK